jgi:phosphodiesterase/alkaline phosphatase D-like protein
MNKTIAGAGLVVGIIIVGGLAYYASQNASEQAPINATSTPVVGGNSEQVPVSNISSPTVLTGANVVSSDTTAVVTGSVIPNGAFTTYWYEYGKTTNLGSKTSNQTVGSGYVTISAPAYIIGLAKDTTYYFRLVAENQLGRITGAQYSFGTKQGNPAPVGALPSTRTLGVSVVTEVSAKLNGEVTPNKAMTQYWFEYGVTKDLGGTSMFTSVGDGSAMMAASAELAGLRPGTTYYFRINAQNQFGTVNGVMLNFKTLGSATASAPIGKTGSATSISTSKATLRGTVDPNGAPTIYWFEYSTDSLLGSVLIQATPQKSAGIDSNTVSVNADVSGLNAKTDYYFRIVVQNSLGTARGERATFKTK